MRSQKQFANAFAIGNRKAFRREPRTKFGRDVERAERDEIVRGQRSISADTASRLARYFGTPERFRLNLQAHYDLEEEKDRLGERLDEK